MSNPAKAGRSSPRGVTVGTLTYALILKTVGRIYGLDMGKDQSAM